MSRFEAAALTRRTVILGVAGSAALLSVGARGELRLPHGLFTLGIASGDPTPDGIVLWTRLAPAPLDPDGGMPPASVPVRWEVAEDEAFARIVRSGVAQADGRWGHSVHVDVAGLRPARRYFYRFIAGGEASPVGRTITAPAPGAKVERLRVCFGSCQKYEVGRYSAYRHIVADDPDLVLFLGDYIYEDKVKDGDEAVRRLDLSEAVDLAGYRARLRRVQTGPDVAGCASGRAMGVDLGRS